MTMWMRWEILSEGDQKSPPEDVPKELDLSRASWQRILKKKDLQRYPYSIQTKRKLTPTYTEKRLNNK